MSINFLDIKYVIIFSLVQYSTAVVLKSPKYYTSIYIKKQSKTTFYTHIPYKARKNNDYNYSDWEETKQDEYDYLLPSTNQPSTTASNIINETSPQELFYPGTPTNPTLPSTTYPTLPSTISTPDTSLPTPSTISTPLSISPSLSTPYNTTTTTLTQKVSSINIPIVTTTPSSTETEIDVINPYLKEEIEATMNKLSAGYFTASVYVLLKIIERKEDIHLISLLEGLEREFKKLNEMNRLAMFGPMVTSVFTSIVKMMAASPVELIKLQAKNGQELIENKGVAFQADTQEVFDIVDTIYIEEDLLNIVPSLTDIKHFPMLVPIPAIDVVQNAMVAFIFVPYARIQGSPKEEELLREINNVVEKRMFGEKNMTMKRDFRKYIEITVKMKVSSVNMTKLKGTQFTKAQRTKGFVWPTAITEPTTINSSETDNTSYVKNPKKMKRLRHKIRTYKDNFRQSRSKERKFKTKRKVTSTVPATTSTTKMPQKHNSKNYMRKNVKKKLYKMKVTTPKASTFTGKYYGKIRKFIYDGNFNGKKDSEKSSSDNENYYSNSDNNNYGADAFKSNVHPQGTLNDAQFHTTNITIDRRFMKKKVNKLRKMDSFSDDEAVLKGNIYKALGYSNDFAKRLRAML